MTFESCVGPSRTGSGGESSFTTTAQEPRFGAYEAAKAWASDFLRNTRIRPMGYSRGFLSPGMAMRAAEPIVDSCDDRDDRARRGHADVLSPEDHAVADGPRAARGEHEPDDEETTRGEGPGQHGGNTVAAGDFFQAGAPALSRGPVSAIPPRWRNRWTNARRCAGASRTSGTRSSRCSATSRPCLPSRRRTAGRASGRRRRSCPAGSRGWASGPANRFRHRIRVSPGANGRTFS